MSRVPWTEHPRVIPWRQRWRPVDVGFETLDGFRRHRTGRNAALVAHYGFLSVFPLLLVATTVLGLVLQDRPDLQADIIDSALAQLPLVGQTLATDPSQLTGSVVVLVLGLLAALWASLKAFVILQAALDDVAEVPLDDRPNLAMTRLHALSGLAIIGSAQVVTAFIATFTGVSGVRAVHRVLLVLAALAVNTAVLAGTYRRLCSRPPSWPGVLPGAVVGGVVFAALQVVGTAVVGRAIARASPVYGSFASVIGLLTWLGLHATVALAGAELNRALLTPPTPRCCHPSTEDSPVEG